MKILSYIIGALIIFFGAVLIVRVVSPEDTWVCVDNAWVKHGNPSAAMPTAGCGSAAVDPKNITYTIDGQPVTLVNGQAETAAAPGSASQTTTRYFGNEATGDLNNDGVPDVAFILTQNSGGSGTFYYVAVALKTSDGYQGTNAILLGDRIAPQSTQIENEKVIVNYADRAAGEPMTTAPSIGVSKYLSVTGAVLAEVPSFGSTP